MNLSRASQSLLLAAALLPAGALWALPTDLDQPIKIVADELDVDDARGVSVYRGDVKYTQGSIELTANELTITATEQRDLERVVAVGKPARFKQQLTVEGGDVMGNARTIDYDGPNQRLLFTGDAKLTYCGDEFTGSRIEYFVAQDLVKASKGNGGERGRVQVTLQPRVRDESGAPASPCRKLKVAP